MIIVKNRTILFANREQYLGTSYDNNSAVRIFQVPRISIDGVDIANLTFVANLKKSNGAKVSSYLEKEIRDEEIILVWEIENEALNPAGTMFLSLRATDSNGTVRWSTYPAVVYAEGSIDAPEVSGDAVLGFERMVARSEELIMELEESEGERVEAEQFREEAEEERASRAEALYGQLGDAIRSADEAAAKANAAAGRLDEVGEAIDSANEAAAVAVQAAENANVAAGVANSASQTATEAKATAESASQTATEAKTAAGNTATEVATLRGEVAGQRDAFTKHESAKNPHGATAKDFGAFPINITPNTDYNAPRETGFYELQGNCPNNPYGSENTNTHFYMFHFKHAVDGYEKQIAFEVVSNNVFKRTKTGGVWSKWGRDIDEHSKPSGTFVGNGSSTARTINVGGIGKVLLLLVDGKSSFVTYDGAITFSDDASGGSVRYTPHNNINFRNGVLTIATSSSYFNPNGVSGEWNLL